MMQPDESFPFVSVGITCFNAADTIAQAIGSALSQNWPQIEVLVVDDASTDKSVEVIARLQDKHPEIRLIRHEVNQGVAQARNTLMAQARGTFLVFFDDDDTSHPDRIARQVSSIQTFEAQSGNQIVVSMAGIRRSYPNGYNVGYKAMGAGDRVPQGHDIVAYHLYLDRPEGVDYGSGTPCCAMMARTQVFRDLGGFDARLRRNEDGEFCIRVGLAGGAIVGCPEELVFQNATGGIDKRPEFSLQADLYIIEKYRSVLEQSGRYRYARGWAQVKYHHHARHRFRAVLALLQLILRHPVLTFDRVWKRVPARLAHEGQMKRPQGKRVA